jgi:Zn-dependent metalloprotease
MAARAAAGAVTTGIRWYRRPVDIRRLVTLWIALCALALGLPAAASAASYFVAPPTGSPIERPPGVSAATPAPQTARAFLERRPAATGLDRAGARLVLTEVRREAGDTRVVRFQQEVGGIPVIGAESLVNVDSDNNVTAATGERLGGATPDLAPALAAGDAVDIALRAVARDQGVPLMSLTAGTPALAIYEPDLLGAPGPLGARLVWDLSVRGRDGRVRVRALIDASRGAVAGLISLNTNALDRRVCDADSTAGHVPCVTPVRVEGDEVGDPDEHADVGSAYDFAGATYDLFSDVLGRDSIDGAGMPIVQTVRYCEPGFACPYDNAFWDGSQAVYGEGWATDDVVAHELTHGVTQHTANLFYYYQSGAINESMSDIFGEITDIKRNLNTATEQWLVGEESPVGAIRDMENPPAFNDPDRVLSALYWDDPGDAGGVHINSGIGNKAAYLIADGATFNGETVQALGVDKAARVHYRALTTLLRSASDYRDLAVALPAACDALVGVNGPGGTISTSDCAQVRAAVRATEMAELPVGTAVPAPVCGPGSVPSQIVFTDDMENPASGRWTATTLTGSEAPWGYASQYPGAWPVFATSGVDNTYGDDFWTNHDSVWSMTAPVAIPANAVLHFRHAFGFDHDQRGNWDGGVLEYSVDNGATWVDAGPLMTAGNGYNGTLRVQGSSNTLKGRQAFVADSKGYTATRADLSGLAGESVRFRFRMGTDSVVYGYGWFIDDVQIHTCVPDPGNGTTPPQTTITQAPVAAINTTMTSVGFTSSEPGSTFECRLDSASFTPCTSPVQLSALTEGPHTFQVRATDPAGNTDETPAQVAFTVDTVAPQTTITQAPAAVIAATATSVSFTGSEAGSTFECRLDAATFTPCASPLQITGLTEGPHTFQVRAADPAGNIGTSPAQASFTVDLPSPELPADPAAPLPAPVPPTSSIGGALTPVGAAPDTTRPVITAARVTPNPFRTRTRARVTVNVRASEPGVIRVQMQRLVPGRRSAGRCRPAATTGTRCTLIVTVRTVSARTSTGVASLRIAGPGIRRLVPGRYRARVTSTDAAGNRSAVRTAAFRVTR